jgi:hypothetical protein
MRGGVRVGAGRKAGSKSKRTQEREQVVAEAAEKIAHIIGADAFGGDAHAFLMAVYKDPQYDMAMRVDCAKAAAPYEKPRLSNIEANVAVTGHEAALDELE